MNRELFIQKLQSPSASEKLRRNYEHILTRLGDNGYFPESVTGTYGGMFPRTVGALARLFIATGELGSLEKCVRFCQLAMLEHRLEHVPHVIGMVDGERTEIVDELCQIDGQAHLILAWALLALARERTDFEDRSYSFFADLTSRSTSGGFFNERPLGRIEPGLILNAHLEHSREWSPWIAYDFLSNSFVAAALENMIKVAERRRDGENGWLWKKRLNALIRNIHQNMIFEWEGKTCFCEMLLPTGRAPQLFSGLSWLNLAPVPSGWQGYDEKIFRNTIELWHEHATIHWNGPSITACEWNVDEELADSVNWYGPDHLKCEWSESGHNNQSYGKMLGWDLLYCVRNEQYDRACDMLDFLENVDKDELYAEMYTYSPTRKEWRLRDAGNGEQMTWLCWALIESQLLMDIPVTLNMSRM